MKTLMIMIGISLLFSATVAKGQQTIIPSVKLLTPEFSNVNSKTLLDGHEMVIDHIIVTHFSPVATGSGIAGQFYL